MNKLGMLILALLLSGYCNGQSKAGLQKNNLPQKGFYSYTPDGRVSYDISTQQILVKVKEGISFETLAARFKQHDWLQPLKPDQLLPSPKVWILKIQPGALSADELMKRLTSLAADPDIIYANPFLVYQDGSLQGIQDRFYVKLKNLQDLVWLKSICADLGIYPDEKPYAHDPLLYFITVPKSSGNHALNLANQIFETGRVQCAEVDFLLLLKRFSTNDPGLPYQWSLNNTGSSLHYNGTPGCDMKIFNAWTLSTGSSAIRIAVIDEGVDLVHPDLVANLVPGFDGTGLGSNGGPSGDDAHGTACAGIIAAVGNNNLGMAGISYQSRIVPVRIAYSSGSSWVTSNSVIGTSIDWAWDQGDADVLSNSWGGGGSSTLINDAITRATTLGRNGLGSPVLFAAGNGNGAVSYPATLNQVVSVTAMSMCNQRKNPSSCDGETWWGSDYGTNTDVSAPGVKIYTCDISGASGYSTGDYTATFNGTSSACPNAAGVMALILSVNSGLNMTQARQILESTCDKVGGYTYTAGVPNQPNGTWSTDLGYGRINAFAAVQLANPQPCINPPAVATTFASPTQICVPGNISLSLSGIMLGTGQTYQWQSSPNNITYTPIAGATSSTHVVAASSTTWYRCLITCGATTASTPVQVTFTNPTISTFPHTENFDAAAGLPCGWTNADVNGDGYTWNNQTTNPRSAPNVLTYAYNTSSAANDWVFTPPLQLTAGTNYRIRFWYRVRSASYPESMEIRWGNSASAAGMTSSTIYTNTNFTNTTYLEGMSSAITPGTSGIYYIGFKATSAADMWDIYVDDITIETIAPCTTPLIGGTISGPASTAAGSPTAYVLSGNTGTNIQWEQSTNSGVSWTPISGATTSNASIVFSPGTVLLRARSSSPATGCADVYSNTLTITVAGLVGDVFSNPILVTLPFTQSYSNASGSGYTSTYAGPNAQASADIFFRLTTGPCADSLKISTCGSSFDTYLHFLDSLGNHIASLDDNGPYCSGLSASMKMDIQPNTVYYVVCEGYNTATGTIQLNIENIGNLTPVVNISASGPTTFCQGGQVTLTANPGSGITWSTGASGASITVSNSGTYSATLNNGFCTGTSNAITVTVNANPVVSASPASGCSGQPIVLTGNPVGGTYSVPNPYIGSSTTYTYSFTDGNGCSAISAPASITVNPVSVNTPQSISQCNSYTWPASGITYTQSGTYTASFLNQYGCDSIRTMYLTILQPSSSNQTQAAFNSYTWPVNGVTYTQSGNYVHIVPNAAGCDSVITLQLTITPMGIRFHCKVILDGPYQAASGLMHDSLRILSLLPQQEPYSQPPYNFPVLGYSAQENLSSSLLTIHGTQAIVDWIYLELRSSNIPAQVLATKRFLLQRDGDIIDPVTGSTTLEFPLQLPGNYYVSVKHRNHLGIMTAQALNLQQAPVMIDFTLGTTSVWVNPLIVNTPRKSLGNNLMALHSGDANLNKNVKYNGTANDKNQVLMAVGQATPNNSVMGYRQEDLNLDGRVRFNNLDNDRLVILNSVGASTPNQILFQHTPN